MKGMLLLLLGDLMAQLASSWSAPVLCSSSWFTE
jgi:hypothetical protein